MSKVSHLEKALNESVSVNDVNDASVVKESELKASQDLEVEKIEIKQPLVKKSFCFHDRNFFSYEMKKLTTSGVVTLDPIVHSEASGKPYSKGICVTCVPCSTRGHGTDGNTCLRRPYCKCYYWSH